MCTARNITWLLLWSSRHHYLIHERARRPRTNRICDANPFALVSLRRLAGLLSGTDPCSWSLEESCMDRCGLLLHSLDPTRGNLRLRVRMVLCWTLVRSSNWSVYAEYALSETRLGDELVEDS